MSTAVLEKSLMDFSLTELISQAIALGGEKVHDMAKATGHIRHKKTWIEVIDQLSAIEVNAEVVEESPAVEECQCPPVSRREAMLEEIERVRNIFDGDEKEIPFTDIPFTDEDEDDIRLAAELSNCPPPPPEKPPIVRPCPILDIPGIKITEKPEQESPRPGEERRATDYHKDCTTCNKSGLLDKNLTCINCGGKGWRTREEQLTIHIRSLCQMFVADLHDTCWAWQGNLQMTNWKEVMGEISSVRWGSCVGKGIWELARRIRDLYQYCDERKPNWGPLFPNVPAPLDRIDENHWLLMLIYPPDKKFTEDNHPYFASDINLAESYCQPKVYDRWGVLGNTHMFIVPNEIQALPGIDAEYLVLRGAE